MSQARPRKPCRLQGDDGMQLFKLMLQGSRVSIQIQLRASCVAGMHCATKEVTRWWRLFHSSARTWSETDALTNRLFTTSLRLDVKNLLPLTSSCFNSTLRTLVLCDSSRLSSTYELNYCTMAALHLPATLTNLTLQRPFNLQVKATDFPTGLTHLTFGGWFDQKVDELPSSITHLAFGTHFQQRVDNLPDSLTHLTFGWHFNQPVDNLPASLTHLYLGALFTHQLDWSTLPTKLEYLRKANKSYRRIGY